MAEISIKINNRRYSLTCDPGQEKRVYELANFVDEKAKEIAASGAANTEQHILALTAILLTDELFEFMESDTVVSQQDKENKQKSSISLQEATLITDAVKHLTDRVETLAKRMAQAA